MRVKMRRKTTNPLQKKSPKPNPKKKKKSLPNRRHFYLLCSWVATGPDPNQTNKERKKKSQPGRIEWANKLDGHCGRRNTVLAQSIYKIRTRGIKTVEIAGGMYGGVPSILTIVVVVVGGKLERNGFIKLPRSLKRRDNRCTHHGRRQEKQSSRGPK